MPKEETCLFADSHQLIEILKTSAKRFVAEFCNASDRIVGSIWTFQAVWPGSQAPRLVELEVLSEHSHSNQNL